MPFFWVAAAGSAISAVGTMQSAGAAAGEKRRSGQAALYEGALSQELANMDADNIMTAARDDADNIKRTAMLMRASMITSQSGSGLVIGEGSAQAAVDQLDALSSADALAALYSGINKASSTRTQGRFAYEQSTNVNAAAGRSAANISTAGMYAGIGQLAGAAATAYKGLNTGGGTTNGGVKVAPGEE